MITIVAVGKKHEDWVSSGVQRYEKRLKQPFDTKWVLLPHSHFDGDRARQEESESILSRVNDTDFIILLDEVGKNLSSPEISELCNNAFSNSQKVMVVIGGAYGVSDAVRERASIIWSISRLVFPHQLVRLILIEQLYRAQEIARGGSYHHT